MRDGPAFHPSGIDFELAVIVPPREFELFLEECPHGFVWVDAYFVGDHDFSPLLYRAKHPIFGLGFDGHSRKVPILSKEKNVNSWGIFCRFP